MKSSYSLKLNHETPIRHGIMKYLRRRDLRKIQAGVIKLNKMSKETLRIQMWVAKFVYAFMSDNCKSIRANDKVIKNK